LALVSNWPFGAGGTSGSVAGGASGCQALLGAVVEVALDASALGLGGVDHPGSAGLDLGHLLGEPLVAAGAEQGGGHVTLDVGDRPHHPGGQQQHQADQDRGHRRGSTGEVQRPEVDPVVGQQPHPVVRSSGRRARHSRAVGAVTFRGRSS
jgi:hypothetical protein